MVEDLLIQALELINRFMVLLSGLFTAWFLSLRRFSADASRTAPAASASQSVHFVEVELSFEI